MDERRARVVARLVRRQRYRPVDFQAALAPLLVLDPGQVAVIQRTRAFCVAIGDDREIYRFFVYRDPALGAFSVIDPGEAGNQGFEVITTHGVWPVEMRARSGTTIAISFVDNANFTAATVEVHDGQRWTGSAWVAEPSTCGVLVTGNDTRAIVLVSLIEAAINGASQLVQVTPNPSDDPANSVVMADMGSSNEIAVFPPGTATYFLASAQELLDSMAASHTRGHVIESINFLCDDPFSLCDRDLLGA
jgi:hypothetical protein